jgi:hypothetical protein
MPEDGFRIASAIVSVEGNEVSIRNMLSDFCAAASPGERSAQIEQRERASCGVRYLLLNRLDNARGGNRVMRLDRPLNERYQLVEHVRVLLEVVKVKLKPFPKDVDHADRVKFASPKYPREASGTEGEQYCLLRLISY